MLKILFSKKSCVIVKAYLNNISKFVKYYIFLFLYYLLTYLNLFDSMMTCELLPYFEKFRKIRNEH